MIFDVAITLVDTPSFFKFVSVATPELIPVDLTGPQCVEKVFARRQIRHPNIIEFSWQASSAHAGCKNAQSIFATVNRREHRLCSDHDWPIVRTG
jgi:hypothetical protein